MQQNDEAFNNVAMKRAVTKMANPQLENGHTRIANEILEQIVKLPLNGTQLRIVLVIWRYTYGFSRKEHMLSVNFIIKALDLKKSQYKQITRELKALIQQGVLTEVVRPDKNKTRVIAFNKNHNLWTKKTSGLIRPVDELVQSEWTKKTREPLEYLDHQERKKKENIKERYTPDFEAWYSLYPNPWNKGQSFRNWQKLLKEETPGNIMNATRNYLRYIEEKNTPKEYVVRSTNFIGQHQEYKAYLDLTPEPSEDAEQPVIHNGLDDEQIRRYLEQKRKRGGDDAEPTIQS